jgi:hypothetical protein
MTREEGIAIRLIIYPIINQNVTVVFIFYLTKNASNGKRNIESSITDLEYRSEMEQEMNDRGV